VYNLISQSEIQSKQWKDNETFAETTCGANKWTPNQNTFELYITNSPDCVLMLKVVNAVTVSFRFNITVDDFFKQGADLQLIKSTAFILRISPAQVRITNVLKGSAIAYTAIFQTPPSLNSNNNNSSSSGITTTTETTLDLNNAVNVIVDSIKNGSLTFSAPIMDLSYTIYIDTTNSQQQSSTTTSSPSSLNVNINSIISVYNTTNTNTNSNTTTNTNGQTVITFNPVLPITNNNTKNNTIFINTNNDNNNKTLIIILSVTIPSLIIAAIIVAIYCCIYKRNQMIFSIIAQEATIKENKIIKKKSTFQVKDHLSTKPEHETHNFQNVNKIDIEHPVNTSNFGSINAFDLKSDK